MQWIKFSVQDTLGSRGYRFRGTVKQPMRISPEGLTQASTTRYNSRFDPEEADFRLGVVMILPQVHLRKPCYDFTFL
jgi:hypothetical protein